MQRRDFLKNLGMTSAVLAAPAVITHASPVPAGKKDLTNIRLKGKVHDNGKGI